MATTQQLLENTFLTLAKIEPIEATNPSSIDKIAIISTPRCGSTYFCEVLRRTEMFGWPAEWFNMRYLQAYKDVLGLHEVNFSEYFQWVLMRTTTGNQIFSANFHVEQYQVLRHQGLDLLKLGFKHTVYLHRRDKLAQAYSLRRAQLTDQWSVDSTPIRQVDDTHLKRSEIIGAVYEIAKQEDFFEQELRPYTDQVYAYEDFTGELGNEVFEDFLRRTNISIGPNALQLDTPVRVQRADYSSAPLENVRGYLCEK